MITEKMKILRKYLRQDDKDIHIRDIEQTAYDEDVIECNGDEYLVCTDEEADKKAKNYIKETVWAFMPWFIIDHCSALDHDDASEKIIKAIQDQCESGNDAMLKLIDDFDEFVEDAIASDGRGHFLATYDGEENEFLYKGEIYYIYRL